MLLTGPLLSLAPEVLEILRARGHNGKDMKDELERMAPDSRATLYYQGGSVIGWALDYGREADETRFLSVFVFPKFRKKGIGTRLVDAATSKGGEWYVGVGLPRFTKVSGLTKKGFRLRRDPQEIKHGIQGI